jgi:dTDP-4-dehydrorhamnose 3,5-epimerase
MIDLRDKSETYRQWFSIELSADNYKMLYVPEGFALGFQALENNCELFYQVSQFYTPTHESGVRWNDPLINIKWPLKPTIMSQKDRSWNLLK